MAQLCAAVLALSDCGYCAAEQPYRVDWIAQTGTRYSDTSTSVTADSTGNVYIGGTTRGSINGAFNIYDQPAAFLTKFDSSGNELWSWQNNNTGDSYGNSVTVDSLGNVYICGKTFGYLGGPSINGDAFLIKFDPMGSVLWSQRIGTAETDGAYDVAIDDTGNIYVSGYTAGSINGPNSGFFDAILTKFDPSGGQLWSRQVGTTEYDTSYALAVDGTGNAYISGSTLGDMAGASAGKADIFLTKFDSSGNDLWSRQIGTAGNDEGLSLAVDGVGNIYVSGGTDRDLAGPNLGGADAFLLKYDPSGDEMWSRQFGSTEVDLARSLAVDIDGYAYISGTTWGDLGGPNLGRTDAFLVKWDTHGNELWSQQLGTGNADASHAVTIDNVGNVYLSGYTYGHYGGQNKGSNDAILIKLAVPEPATLMVTILGGATILRRR